MDQLSEDELPEAQRLATEIAHELLDGDAYSYDVSLKNPNRVGHPGADEAPLLRFMPAGRFDDHYPERVRTFDWRALADGHPFIFSALAEALAARYEYVLIDSRTGITDVAGVCTALLPDKLVLVFSLNEQSLHGAVQIGAQAWAHRAALEPGRPLLLFPLPSRVEFAEQALTDSWSADARRRFEDVFQQMGDRANWRTYFDQVRIPHIPFYAFGEQIAAERSRESETQSLTEAYGRFLRFLRGEQGAVETSGPQRALPLGADSLLLVSIGGGSLWPAVQAVCVDLNLSNVVDHDVMDFSSSGFVEDSPRGWEALAADLRDRLRPFIENPRFKRYHLFYRGPVVLAPLLGALIVPSKPLHIYYYENGSYHLAYVCDRRLVKGT